MMTAAKLSKKAEEAARLAAGAPTNPHPHFAAHKAYSKLCDALRKAGLGNQ